ncbi:insulin-like peptide INSL6 [Microcebus murinus]|uniref:Insulin-like peptide INSL6 n=1 Tax=Microcebus murinus TaxID=30608 RepID=A0A8C5XXB5_MICMU|nr:insulin-like peptide INSL6 [Microcebus murinus]
MSRLLCLCLLWLGLLMVRFSSELSDISIARRLCGRYLVREIVKLCGDADWSHVQFEEDIPLTQLLSETFMPDQFQSPQTFFPSWGRVTNPVATSVSREEAINSWEMHSLPRYHHKKVNSDKTRLFSSSQAINPYIDESVKFQKKSINKIKTLNNLFWGNHPQRKRRGYSEKCCLRGCTKEELSIACLPYINFKNLKEKGSSLVTEIY